MKHKSSDRIVENILRKQLSMDLINRNLKIPYYQQLYEILRNKIINGTWKPGDLIPAEPELIATYQVSRNTVRDVMDMLVSEGLIFRERGRGSFVSKPSMQQGLGRMINFTQDMHQRGLKASSRVLSAELIPSPEDIAEKLQIPVGEELGFLRRLRLGNDDPISIEDSYLNHRYCPGFLTRHDYSIISLRESLAKDYGLMWVKASQVIRSINASRDIAQILDVAHRSAILFIERITYNEQELPVEFLRIYYRGDRYSLLSELTM